MATGQAVRAEPAAVQGALGKAGAEVDGALFKQVMGSFATGVTVVTTQVEGRVHGMTANAFMAGSLEPPLCVISVGNGTRLLEHLRQSGCYGVSILRREQRDLSNHFAGRGGVDVEPEFRYLGDVPVLPRSLAVIAAEVIDSAACGDHTLFIGRITGMEASAAPPLLHFRSGYAALETPRSDEATVPPMFW